MNLSGFSTGNFEVVRSDPKKLIVRHSRVRALVGGAFVSLFVGVWYWFALSKPDSIESAMQAANAKLHGGAGSWLFLFIPLLLLGSSFVHLGRVALLANRIEHDAQTRTIRYGRKELPFREVATVQLRLIHGAESPDEHLVSLVLNDKSKLRVVSHTDRDRIVAAADDIAEMLDAPVEKVGG